MLARSFGRHVELFLAPDAPPGGKPPSEWASLGANAPIAWPSGFARDVPVTGQLSPHAQAALERMGITKPQSPS